MTDETEPDHRQRSDDERMADVNHEAPEGTDANDVWIRGRLAGSPDR